MLDEPLEAGVLVAVQLVVVEHDIELQRSVKLYEPVKRGLVARARREGSRWRQTPDGTRLLQNQGQCTYL